MNRGRRKTRVGRVISDKMEKTVVVAIEWRQRHRIYQKSVRRYTKLMAHDEQSVSTLGDLVRLVETRPLSRTKRWRVSEVLETHEVPEVKPVEVDARLVEEIRLASKEAPAAEVTEEAPAAEAAEEAPAAEAAEEAPAAEAAEEASSNEKEEPRG